MRRDALAVRRDDDDDPRFRRTPFLAKRRVMQKTAIEPAALLRPRVVNPASLAFDAVRARHTGRFADLHDRENPAAQRACSAGSALALMMPADHLAENNSIFLV
jgi:hypothetical protein